MKAKPIVLTAIVALLLLALIGNPAINKENPTIKGQLANSHVIIEGSPNSTITIVSPQNITYDSDNVTVAFLIQSNGKPLEYSTAKLFEPFFRYGCFLDYGIIANQTIDLDHWNPDRAGFIPNSNVNITIHHTDEGWLCNATITKLSEGSHYITAWVDEELNYISYGEHVGSVFSTVDFTVDTQPSSSTSPSPSPTPSSSQPTDRNAPHLDPIVYLILVSVIVAVTVVSVLLYGRHRKLSSVNKP
jgi:hypothetical protein